MEKISNKGEGKIDLLKFLGQEFAVLEKKDAYEILLKNDFFGKYSNVYNHDVNPNAAIAYITRGSCDLVINDIVYTLKEGDVIIIPTGYIRNSSYRQVFSRDDVDYISVVLSPEFIQNYLNTPSISPSFIAILKREFLVARSFYKMEDYMNSLKDLYKKSKDNLTDLDKHLRSHSVIYILKKINEYLINKTYIRKTDPRDEIINKLHDLFIENPTINYSVEEYSQKLYISKYILNKISKEIKGLTAKELINKWLMYEIRRDLLTSDLIVKEIAAKYGFSESTNFSKFFRRNEKMNVREYLKKFEETDLIEIGV
ncbi:hypothetical protein UJ101_02508 [Flavobacteriaceae bacterium UJ101]|nr:hypothetical protein UJ101_02508 [Flavobacteriaceae bacterium UJ101]